MDVVSVDLPCCGSANVLCEQHHILNIWNENADSQQSRSASLHLLETEMPAQHERKYLQNKIQPASSEVLLPLNTI